MVPAARIEPKLPELTADCTTVRLSEIGSAARRLDAEVYLSDGYLIRRALERSTLSADLLGDIASIWQPSRLKGIQVGENGGVPFLAATQVFDIWPTPRKWLARSRTPDLKDRFVDPGWILVTCSGTVGNAIVTYSAHDKLVVSHDLLRVQIENAEKRHYVYAFLRTRHGRAMMRGTHYGNIIKHLEVEHLSELPVPSLPELYAEAASAISSVFAKRDEAYRLDVHARDLFADRMPKIPTPTTEVGFTVRAQRLFANRRRLDGYAHNPRALAVAQAFQGHAGTVDRLGDLVRLDLPNRFARTYTETGTPLFGSEDIFKINPEITKFLAPAMRLDLKQYRVRSGWLLLARSGQIYGINGSVILANAWHESGVVSEHVIRIVPRTGSVRPGYLQAMLSHPDIGQPLVLCNAFGTSIPELAPEDIAEIPVPRLAKGLEDEIADAVERASELRMEADKQENGIVGKLEDAIDEKIGKPHKLRPDANETAFRRNAEAVARGKLDSCISIQTLKQRKY